MAQSMLLHLWVFLATLAVSKPSTTVSYVDYVTNEKLIQGLAKDFSKKNHSEEEEGLGIQKLEEPKVSSLEEGNVEDLLHTKPPSEKNGNFQITAAFIPGRKPVQNAETYLDSKSDTFPNNRDKTVLVVNNKMSQTSFETMDHTSSEESLTRHDDRKTPSRESKKLEHNLKGKSSIFFSNEDEGTRMKPIEMLPKPLPMGNHVEPENDRTTHILSTVSPTVSTIALVARTQPYVFTGEAGPFTQIQKLQIDSGSVQDNEALSKNSLVVQADKNSSSLRGSSEALRQISEGNFLDDNLIPKVLGVQPSEKYHAAYRTTESYSALQDTRPHGNEVISADVDLRHSDDNLHYQKDSNSIPEESMAAENVTGAPNVSTFLHKQKANGQKTFPTGISVHFLPSDPSIKQEQPTLQSFPSKTNLPYATVDHTKHVPLEAKSRTQTERMSPSPNLRKSFLVKNGDGDLGGFDSQLSVKTIPQEISSQQAHETPTPAMQVSSKDPDKLLDPETSPVESDNGLTMTQRNPISDKVPPELIPSTTLKTRQQGNVPEENTHRTDFIATPQAVPSSTKRAGRRGEIRVTTQRALHKSKMLDVPTSLPSKKTTSDATLCAKAGGECEFLGSNKTLLTWDDLQRTLSFAWEMHVYGTAVLFILLSVVALINLIGSPILRVSYLPYIVTSNLLLFISGVLRAVFFLMDPYGSKSRISQGIALVLYNVTFPLMLFAFATLVLLVLKMARLQLLPPNIQSLALLAVIGVIHFIVLLSADLLAHLLNPSVNVVLQTLSISWGVFLMVGNFVAYFRVRRSGKDIVNETQRVSPACEDIVVVQTAGRNIKCLFTSSRVLLVSSVFGLLCCGLQVYAVLWIYGLFGKKDEFSWSWWFLQFWFRIFELALCFSMLFVASHSFCVQCGSNDHTCWSKIISYFCTYKKTEVPEYPNNCYDWTNSIQDRIVNNNISKSIIRNHPENVPLRIVKESNETKSTVFGYDSRSSSPLFKPKPESFGPKSQNVTMGRSHTSICFEKESMLSLTDLEFRPPSPINLSRSIDEALFREHLVRDSIFLDSSLQYPNYLIRQDSCSSLKECSALNQTVDPLISADLKMRRSSNPDFTYSLARCNSGTEVDTPTESLQQSKELPHDVPTEGLASVSSLDSFSKGSLKISWNPWQHGLSSVESLPLEDTPDAQLLKQDSQPSIVSKTSNPEKTLGKRFMERSQTTDSNSIASETIEL
ncbi:proline-rich transmembrane protein 3 [Spea bombifrons]|uniref:proline-rich transmembrane protein 3 n=1 Tax=Spea bombifrons TaxID=233779 RepID=UPI00234951BF|nr:proline-rich transmembrane protein 3 [Spea bombifrons]